MVEAKEGRTLALFMARERATSVVFSTVVPRQSRAEWTCRRLMALLRDIGLEFVDIIVESDNEPALTSLTQSWSTLRAMKSGSGMTIQNSPFGSWNGNGIVERAIQSGQGVIRTLRSTIEEQWEVELLTHSVWLWIAEQARFLLTRFDLGGDGKSAYERL